MDNDPEEPIKRATNHLVTGQARNAIFSPNLTAPTLGCQFESKNLRRQPENPQFDDDHIQTRRCPRYACSLIESRLKFESRVADELDRTLICYCYVYLLTDLAHM